MGSSLSTRQLDTILNDIALTASHIDALSVEMSCKVDEEDKSVAYALAHTIAALAQRIGWAADFVAHKSACLTYQGESAEDWMLPPSYHRQDEEAKPPQQAQALRVVRKPAGRQA